MKREKYPEKIPFRLTRMLIQVIVGEMIFCFKHFSGIFEKFSELILEMFFPKKPN